MEKQEGSSDFLKKIGLAINIFVNKYPWECRECGKKDVATMSVFRLDHDVDDAIERHHQKKSPQCMGKASLV